MVTIILGSANDVQPGAPQASQLATSRSRSDTRGNIRQAPAMKTKVFQPVAHASGDSMSGNALVFTDRLLVTLAHLRPVRPTSASA
jgi:hypothetical protein